jgi:hypothetical protein
MKLSEESQRDLAALEIIGPFDAPPPFAGDKTMIGLDSARSGNGLTFLWMWRLGKWESIQLSKYVTSYRDHFDEPD